MEELDLPPRPLNVLRGEGITTLADIVRHPKAELAALKNFGGKDAWLLRQKLNALGLRFGMVRSRRRRSIRSLPRERRS